MAFGICCVCCTDRLFLYFFSRSLQHKVRTRFALFFVMFGSRISAENRSFVRSVVPIFSERFMIPFLFYFLIGTVCADRFVQHSAALRFSRCCAAWHCGSADCAQAPQRLLSAVCGAEVCLRVSCRIRRQEIPADRYIRYTVGRMPA